MITNRQLNNESERSKYHKALNTLFRGICNRFCLKLKTAGNKGDLDEARVSELLVLNFGEHANPAHHLGSHYLALYVDDRLVGASLYSGQKLLFLVANDPSLKGCGTLLYTVTLALNGCLYYESSRFALLFYQKVNATRLDGKKFDFYHTANRESMAFLIETIMNYVEQQQLDRLREFRDKHALLVRNRYFLQVFGASKYRMLVDSQLTNPEDKLTSTDLSSAAANSDETSLQYHLEM